MLINVGNDLVPGEKCSSMWKSLQGVVRISGVVIQSFSQFQKIWEESSPACLSVKVDVEAANKLQMQPYAYSVESVGQNKGFQVDGLDMFQTQVVGGTKNLGSQDVIHFTIANVSRLLEAGFSIDKPEKVQGMQVSEVHSKLYHILHETRYFSEAATTNRSEPPIKLSLRGNPEGLFPQHLCLAKITLFRQGVVESVWTNPRTAGGPSFFAGYGNGAQTQGTNLELQINIRKPYLKAFQHD